MLNGKQRAALRSAASKIDAIFQIGKGGLGDAAVKSIGDALEARELVKITVLDNTDVDLRETADELAKRTGSEVVSVIGRRIILFRVSSKPEKRVISALL
jgi:RNA-binding protein